MTLTSAPAGTVTSSDVALSFTSDDPLATFACRLDGAAWLACGSPTGYTLANGTHTVDVRAVGANGTGPEVTARFDVAAPAPQVILANVPTATYASMSFDVATDDPSATLTCQLDGGTVTACSGTQTYSGLTVGTHTVNVVATSPLTGSTSQRFTFPTYAEPAVTITTAGIDGTGVLATVTFTGTDATSYECSLDGGAWGACSSPATFPSLAAGSHVVAVRGIGPAGPGAPVQTGPMTAGAPTSYTNAPTGAVLRATQTFAIAPVPLATYECAVDGAAFLACSNPTTLTLAPGPHTVQMRAVVGSTAASPASTSFTVVSGAVTLSSTPSLRTSVKTATFVFTGATGLTFQCGLNTGGWTPCTSPVNYSGLVKGQQTFRVRAVDSSGAFGSATTYSWTIT